MAQVKIPALYGFGPGIAGSAESTISCEDGKTKFFDHWDTNGQFSLNNGWSITCSFGSTEIWATDKFPSGVSPEMQAYGLWNVSLVEEGVSHYLAVTYPDSIPPGAYLEGYQFDFVGWQYIPDEQVEEMGGTRSGDCVLDQNGRYYAAADAETWTFEGYTIPCFGLIVQVTSTTTQFLGGGQHRHKYVASAQTSDTTGPLSYSWSVPGTITSGQGTATVSFYLDNNDLASVGELSGSATCTVTDAGQNNCQVTESSSFAYGMGPEGPLPCVPVTLAPGLQGGCECQGNCNPTEVCIQPNGTNSVGSGSDGSPDGSPGGRGGPGPGSGGPPPGNKWGWGWGNGPV